MGKAFDTRQGAQRSAVNRVAMRGAAKLLAAAARLLVADNFIALTFAKERSGQPQSFNGMPRLARVSLILPPLRGYLAKISFFNIFDIAMERAQRSGQQRNTAE